MKDLIHVESSKLAQDAIVVMFELDLTKLGLGVFRFADSSSAGEIIRFNGEEYPPAPIEATGFQWDGASTMPRPSLKVAAKDLYFLNMVVDADDLVGSPVKRLKTYAKYLDNGSYPNTGATFPEENFVIERKTTQTRHLLEFELSTELDQQGVQIPRLKVMRDSCVHRYRYWNGTRFVYTEASCPYAGTKYFKHNGEPTTDPTQDYCGKRISDCKLRFGDKAVLPRLAFPGVDRY